MLYQVADEYWPEFQAELASHGKYLPSFICREFEPFPLRFLFASRPAIMGRVLGTVYRAIATHLRRKAGYTKASAQTGAVTLIQRFGGAVNLNIHFHMLFLDGVYIGGAGGSDKRFRGVKAPTSDELTQLTHTMLSALPVAWNARGCWCGMPTMTISQPTPWIAPMTIRCITCSAIPSLTASPWDHSRGAKCLPCKLCPTAGQTIHSRLSK